MHSRRGKQIAFMSIVVPALIVAGVAAVTIGSTHVDWQVTLRVIAAKLLPFWIHSSGVDPADELIIWMIRIPRVLVAALVGAGLAAAGAMMQGLFRNPLADPNIVGVGAGASLGAVIVAVSGLAATAPLALPIAAFLGALFSLASIYALATRRGATPVTTLLLSGIAIGTLLGAISSFVLSMTMTAAIAQQLTFWTMGGLNQRTWTHVWISAPFVLVALILGLSYARELDLLAESEEVAGTLGVQVERSKRIIVITAALLTGSAVAVAGAIGFIGLIVPHMVRLWVGPSHRALLPASALTGAVFLIVCDLISRTLRPPTEIRLGIITAAFGTPFFLLLLIRKYRAMNA